MSVKWSATCHSTWGKERHLSLYLHDRPPAVTAPVPVSFQVRGSIPLHWEQVVDLTYKPKMKYLGEEVRGGKKGQVAGGGGRI